MSDVVALSADYEKWLRARIPVVEADLTRKHAEMAASPMRFLRGTYYLWLRRMTELVPELLRRPAVPLVGDLHVENFGTWIDHRGVRRWGVNDFDELGWGAYPIDLVRLTTSALLTPGIGLSCARLCTIVLDSWHAARPGRAVDVDAGPAHHLRRMVPMPAPGRPFYRDLERGAPAEDQRLPHAVRTAALRSAPAGWQPSWHVRQAGTGSLGHPRLVGVGRDAAGDWGAREVKLLGPPTVEWLPEGDCLPVVDDLLFGRIISEIRGPHPSRRVSGWQIRRLAPDVVRIELAGLRRRDVEQVVASMAAAVVDVHGSDRTALRTARADATQLDAHWLVRAVEVMAADTRDAYQDWHRTHSS